MKQLKAIAITTILALSLTINFGFVSAQEACDIAEVSDPLICGSEGSDEEVELMARVEGILNTIYLWIGIIAVVVIVIGGIQYMTAQGEAEKVKRAKTTITYSIAGLVVTLSAFAMTTLVINSLDGKTTGGGGSGGELLKDRDKVRSIKAVSQTTLTVGQNAKIQAKVVPDYAKNKQVSFTSSKPDVATIGNDGEVSAKKAGDVEITISSADGPQTKVKVKVLAPVAASSVNLNPSSVKLKKGKTTTIKASIKPNNAADKTVTWSTSNKKIATVNQSGVVKAIDSGTATITATARNQQTVAYRETGQAILAAAQLAKEASSVKATAKVTVESEAAATQPSTANQKWSGRLDFRKQTRKIINPEMSKFNYANVHQFLKSKGGYTKYVKSLGGVFATYAGNKIRVKTAADVQAAAEYVWGLWTIWGPDYRVGDPQFVYNWRGGKSDGFYYGLPGRDSELGFNGSSINKQLSESTNVRTNCNYAVNTFLGSTKLRSIGGSSWGSQGKNVTGNKRIKYISDLQVGDLIYFSNDGGHGYHHVAVVGEVYKDYVIIYDGGSRWIRSGNFKKKLKRKKTNVPNEDYSTDNMIVGYRPWTIDQSVTLEGLK